MQFLLCCPAVSVVVELPHLHLFISNFLFMQIDHDEDVGTDSRADDHTEANVSNQHTNDVGLQHPVVDVSQSLLFVCFYYVCSPVSIVVELPDLHLFINFSFHAGDQS